MSFLFRPYITAFFFSLIMLITFTSVVEAASCTYIARRHDGTVFADGKSSARKHSIACRRAGRRCRREYKRYKRKYGTSNIAHGCIEFKLGGHNSSHKPTRTNSPFSKPSKGSRPSSKPPSG